MRKISIEQFAKEYGADQLIDMGIIPKADNFLSKPWYQQIFTKEVAQEIPRASYDVTLGPALKFTKSAIEAPGNIVQSAMGKPITSTTGKGLLGEPITSYQKDFQEKTLPRVISGEQTPLSATVGTVGEVLGGGATALGVAEGVAKIPGSVNTARTGITETVGSLKEGAKDLITTAKGKVVKPKLDVFDQSIQDAKTILNPSEYYSPSEKLLAQQKGNIKVVGEGPLKKEIIDIPPTLQDETVARLVSEGKISTQNMPSQNIAAIKQEVKALDSGIDEIVSRPELNKPFTTNTINKSLDNVYKGAKDNLTFVSKTVEDRAYMEVVDSAKREIAKFPQNSSGLRQAIKSFNAKMESLLGKDIYGGATESVGNARLQAVKDVRKNLNDFLATNLESPTITKSALAGENVGAKLPAKSTFDYGRQQAGSIYKNQLQQEAQLLNAVDELSFRASKNIDKTKLQLWLKAHPVAQKMASWTTGGFSAGGFLKIFGF
jgi:hypothetical protein